MVAGRGFEPRSRGLF